MYSEDFTKIATDRDEFWTIIELNFEAARHVLADFPLESREDALSSTYRDGKARGSAMKSIRYRDTSEGYDSREYYLQKGREILPIVAGQIAEAALTASFLQYWGELMFYHGFIASFVLDDSDDLGAPRAASKSAFARSIDAKRSWVAKAVELRRKAGVLEKTAEWQVAEVAKSFIARGGCEGFNTKWFADLLRKGELKSSYTGQGKLTGDTRRDALRSTLPIPPLEPDSTP